MGATILVPCPSVSAGEGWSRRFGCCGQRHHVCARATRAPANAPVVSGIIKPGPVPASAAEPPIRSAALQPISLSSPLKKQADGHYGFQKCHENDGQIEGRRHSLRSKDVGLVGQDGNEREEADSRLGKARRFAPGPLYTGRNGIYEDRGVDHDGNQPAQMLWNSSPPSRCNETQERQRKARCCLNADKTQRKQHHCSAVGLDT